MWNNGQNNIWQDLQDTWNDQPQSEKINIQISQLINEFKSKVSQFENDSINSDVVALKANWTKAKSNNVSQFEKDSIKKDINLISRLIKKVIHQLKR